MSRFQEGIYNEPLLYKFRLNSDVGHFYGFLCKNIRVVISNKRKESEEGENTNV